MKRRIVIDEGLRDVTTSPHLYIDVIDGEPGVFLYAPPLLLEDDNAWEEYLAASERLHKAEARVIAAARYDVPLDAFELECAKRLGRMLQENVHRRLVFIGEFDLQEWERIEVELLAYMKDQTNT